MSGREAINYAARARASLSLALVSFEPFYGVLRPGEGIRFSTHVDPSSAPSNVPQTGTCGGAAGYCPRVRCAYCTIRFITIAGRTRHDAYGTAGTVFQPCRSSQAAMRWTAFGLASGNPAACACASSSCLRAISLSRSAARSTSVLRHWANMPSEARSSSLT